MSRRNEPPMAEHPAHFPKGRSRLAEVQRSPMPETVRPERHNTCAATRLPHNAANSGGREFRMRRTQMEEHPPASAGDPILLTIIR